MEDGLFSAFIERNDAMDFLGYGAGVEGPGEFGALDNLHAGAVQLRVVTPCAPKVNNQLFCFIHFQRQAVDLAPLRLLLHLLSVCWLVVLSDMTHCKLDDGI